MKNIPIIIPRKAHPDQIASAIDLAIDELNLTVVMRDIMKKYPGSVHWHLKNRDAKNRLESGTLEVTFWPDDHRAWFTIQDGRKADWIEAKLKLLKKAIRF